MSASSHGKLISPLATSSAVAAVMRANKKHDTGPEMIVRRLLFSLGYRYRVHSCNLPGHPDIVFATRRKVIFVHGCFWHQHKSADCPLYSHPRSNLDYWTPKLRRNRERDVRNEAGLRKIGWQVMVVWECETGDSRRLADNLKRFVGRRRRMVHLRGRGGSKEQRTRRRPSSDLSPI